MIVGAHTVIYSTDADADRRFVREVLGLTYVDAGDGWLIFALPPAEVAFHPSKKNDVHEFFLLCDDVAAFAGSMAERGVACAPVKDMSWGTVTELTLPGGGKLGVYQPKHARPGAIEATSRPGL
jgi:catechol 2,3-dioxygenase-like lactoylglutathione lyase family enzyme